MSGTQTSQRRTQIKNMISGVLPQGLADLDHFPDENIKLVFDKVAPVPSEFPAKNPDIIAHRKKELRAHYNQETLKAFKFFEDNNMKVASVLFEILLEYKNGKIRKDEYSPEESHEMEQFLPIMYRMMAGKFNSRLSDIIEKHGSIESWICTAIAHDIGENYNIYHDDLIEKIQLKMIEKYERITPEEQSTITRMSNDMEHLTHYRKYSVSDFEKLTGKALDLSNPNPDGIVDLRAPWNDFFWDKINCFEDGESVGRSHMQVYAKPGSKGQYQIIVTQYGYSHENLPTEDTVFGPDWALYVEDISDYKNKNTKTYRGPVKAADSVTGEASRAAANFTLADTTNYYLLRKVLFTDIAVSHRLVGPAGPETPLAPEINSIFAMHELLNFLGGIFVVVNPANRQPGERCINPAHLVRKRFENEDTGESSLFISRFFQKDFDANLFYEDTPRQSHPLVIFMRQLRDAQNLGDEYKILYEEIKKALLEVGGSRMEDLLLKPEDRPFHRPSALLRSKPPEQHI